MAMDAKSLIRDPRSTESEVHKFILKHQFFFQIYTLSSWQSLATHLKI